MRTLVVSDLHLGASTKEDLLARRALLEPLLEAVRDADRLVLLGDALELREGPEREVAAAAAGVFAELGRALGPDGELVMLAGNHDHGLVAGWIAGRLQVEPPGFLGLEQRIAPGEAGPLAASLAERAAAGGARVEVAYPGLFVRDDVYALHGHYGDVHTSIPTFERIAAGAMARWVTGLPEHGATADDYEAVLSPLYAWMHTVAQRADHGAVAGSATLSTRAWTALAGSGRRRRPVRAAALGAGYVAGVAALNAAGLGPLDRTLTGGALRQGGLRGISEVLRRLGVRTPHVLFGHTHRSGPWPGDSAAEWTTPAGTRLHNCGSWVYQPHFVPGPPGRSPYWPGTGIVVEAAGPPRLVGLLADRGHEELAARDGRPPRGVTAPAAPPPA